MTKELEALETYLDKRIKDIKNYLEFNERSEDEKGFTPSEELQICYLAKRMLAIENSEPSEALNYLDQFINEMTECLKNPKQYAKDYDKEIFYKYKYTFETTIKQALLKAQEQEKVLKIIFEKKVVVEWFTKKRESEKYFKLEIYNAFIPVERQLTQEEFDLLKRWLENES